MVLGMGYKFFTTTVQEFEYTYYYHLRPNKTTCDALWRNYKGWGFKMAWDDEGLVKLMNV